jgi:hypothetical protein
MTINEMQKRLVTEKIMSLSSSREEELNRHIGALKRIERLENNLHKAMMLLNGSKGYVRTTRSEYQIESGFTAFEEISQYIGEFGIEISLEPMPCPFGSDLWAVSENGMMNLVETEMEGDI